MNHMIVTYATSVVVNSRITYDSLAAVMSGSIAVDLAAQFCIVVAVGADSM